MRDNGARAGQEDFRDEDLASLLQQSDGRHATALDSHLRLDNDSISFFNNLIL